jgi:hypothetical protein
VIPPFLISLVAGTLIQTWIFNRTRGSVFAQMLFHATVNTVGSGLVFPLMKGPNFVTFWYVYALLWLAAGVVVSIPRRGGLQTAAPGDLMCFLRRGLKCLQHRRETRVRADSIPGRIVLELAVGWAAGSFREEG